MHRVTFLCICTAGIYNTDYDTSSQTRHLSLHINCKFNQDRDRELEMEHQNAPWKELKRDCYLWKSITVAYFPSQMRSYYLQKTNKMDHHSPLPHWLILLCHPKLEKDGNASSFLKRGMIFWGFRACAIDRYNQLPDGRSAAILSVTG